MQPLPTELIEDPPSCSTLIAAPPPPLLFTHFLSAPPWPLLFPLPRLPPWSQASTRRCSRMRCAQKRTATPSSTTRTCLRARQCWMWGVAPASSHSSAPRWVDAAGDDLVLQRGGRRPEGIQRQGGGRTGLSGSHPLPGSGAPSSSGAATQPRHPCFTPLLPPRFCRRAPSMCMASSVAPLPTRPSRLCRTTSR